MTFRWRLIIALLLAGIVPLIPLYLTVRGVIQTGVESLAPEETGDAIQSAMELVRDELQLIRDDLPDNLSALMYAIDPPGQPPTRFPHLHPRRALFVNDGGEWYSWTNDGWQGSTPPPPVRETAFGQFPEGVQERRYDSFDREWVLVHELPASFRDSALSLQQAMADWTVSSEQRDRLFASLTWTFVLYYVVVMVLSILLGVAVVWPLTRRITALTEVAESIRTGNEDVRADESGGAETERLARTFNLMLERLVASRVHAAEMEKRAAWRELAPVLAHEIKNPLTPIQLSVQQVAESYTGDDDRFAKTLRTTREIVDEEVERLRNLVRDFGDFARAPAPNPETVNITEFVDDLAGLYGDRVEVVSDCDGIVEFDREQVRRALVNLLDNACSAAEEAASTRDDNAASEDTTGLRVRFSCERDGSELRFIIEDNGPGVSDDQRESIFEPYVTTKSNGIGLGLPVVKNTAEQHGGRVWVEPSDDLGGARFVFEIQS
ncbi:HAMP domain-containing protein [bacterium]|nr:HAMP domain-containing protein [bacterium]